MTEYIDRTVLLNHLKNCKGQPPEMCYSFALISEIERFVKSQPTVDAVPVIRCCQCKASEPTDTSNTVFCKAWRRIVFKNGFCSYADRKEED